MLKRCKAVAMAPRFSWHRTASHILFKSRQSFACKLSGSGPGSVAITTETETETDGRGGGAPPSQSVRGFSRGSLRLLTRKLMEPQF